MKVLVLGIGLQGKAVIHDLEQSDIISAIIAADINISNIEPYLKRKGYVKTKAVKLDVAQEPGLARVFIKMDVLAVVCMLPIELAFTVAKAALEAGIPFVSSNYTYDLKTLNAEAKAKGTIILPEMGLDPGIDLIMGRLAVDQLDEVHGLYSYGGGIPAPECADDNPLKYKISWIFDRVLAVYTREARLIKNGDIVVVPGDAIFHPDHVHEVEFAGIGAVEAYPNGDAARYVELFGLGRHLREMGRFALRWPGHSRFWRKMVALGLLDDTPVEIGSAAISPRSFLIRCLTPKLQYGPNDRDLALLRVQAWGLKNGRKVKITHDMTDYRDLESGFFAMNRTVGFTSAIGALMILSGQITQTGVLSPVRHVPPDEFIKEIEARGVHINSEIEEL